MRFVLFAALVIVLASCDFFSDPGNRAPRIAYAQMFAVDTLDVFEVTMRVAAADLDNNLERLDCAGLISYTGRSPVDTTVTFPFSDTGRDIWSNCSAVDTEGARSDTLLVYTTLPDTSQSTAGSIR